MIITKHPIIFFKAKKKIPESSWITHTPFAFFLISILKPKVYVELGVFSGQSYHAVCQAVKSLKTDTMCYGIDTWRGDDHVSFYNEQIYKEINDYNHKEYGKFSTLLRMSFEEGLNNFADGSIDLLHIDGYHTYEAVKHDFETWLPKMSKNGVIMFHDTFVKDIDFGVWKFWKEVSKKYPSFEFYHGYGLGIIAVGKKVNTDFLKFLNDKENSNFYRKLFSSLGNNVLNDALNDRFTPDLFQYFTKIKQQIDKYLPDNSLRRKFINKTSNGLLKTYRTIRELKIEKIRKKNSSENISKTSKDYYEETLKSIKSLPVPQNNSPKRKCAIFVMVQDEKIFLPIWLKYYSQYFNSEDIYVFDHRTTDGSVAECQNIFKFNVIKLDYPYSFDHEWFKFVANNTQKKLLESYEYVIFTDIDEILLPNKDKYTGLDDYINKIKDDYVQCLGYDLIHIEKEEPNFKVSKSVLSQRKYWYHTSWYNKILISKHTLDWAIGFHEVKNIKSIVDEDLLLIHLHKFDFKQCWEKSFNRARLKWLPSEIIAKRGWQNRITDIDEFRDYYYGWPAEIEIVEIPEKIRKINAF